MTARVEPSLLAAERRALLLARIDRDGSVRTRTAAIELGVPEAVIGRDLRNLANAGACRRVYGGAVSVGSGPEGSPLRAADRDGERAAAFKATELIAPGDTVVLDGGHLIVAVAEAIPRGLRCLVVTRNPAVALALAWHRAVDVDVVGGRVSPRTGQCTGPSTVTELRRVSANLMLTSVEGVHPDRGLTVNESEDATLKRLLAACAERVYVVFTADQFGRAAPHRFAHLTAVDGLVTDQLRPGALRVATAQRLAVV